MRHVVLASHHRFAEGLADTLKFLGCKNDFRVVCAYVDQTPLEEQVREALKDVDAHDEVLVCTDIMQGSVNQAFAPFAGSKTFVVAGANVALVFELCLKPEPLSPSVIEEAIFAARSSMCLINTAVVEDGEDDE